MGYQAAQRFMTSCSPAVLPWSCSMGVCSVALNNGNGCDQWHVEVKKKKKGDQKMLVFPNPGGFGCYAREHSSFPQPLPWYHPSFSEEVQGQSFPSTFSAHLRT